MEYLIHGTNTLPVYNAEKLGSCLKTHSNISLAPPVYYYFYYHYYDYYLCLFALQQCVDFNAAVGKEKQARAHQKNPVENLSNKQYIR